MMALQETNLKIAAGHLAQPQRKHTNSTEKNKMDLTQISDGMASAVEKAAVSMVKVAGRRRGGATGIVWADGLIVTADHVLPGDEKVDQEAGKG